MSTLSLRKIKHDSASVDNVTLNTDGGVGIGGIDPSTLPTFVDHAVRVQNGGGLGIQSASATDNRWIFFGHGTANLDVQRAGIVNQGSDQSLALATAGAQRLIVDASGRVTMPNQPLFVATSTISNWGWNNGKITAFDSSPYSGQNVGSHYNTSTQRFTAPVTGNYLFNLKVTLNTSFGNWQVRIHKNGNWHQTLLGQSSGVANDQRSGSALVQLNVNDFVELFGTGQHSGMLNGIGYCEFSGQLVA